MLSISPKIKRESAFFIMLMPGIVVTLIYNYLPMAGIIIAFQDFVPIKGFFKSEWVGFENFIYIFKLPDTQQAIFNTVYISSLKILAGIIVPVTFSLLLNEIRTQIFKRGVQTIVYLPYFISWVILSGILIDILSPTNGIVNLYLSKLGIEPIFFLGDNRWFPYTLVITDLWKTFGWATIIYLASLTNIDPNLYEAAIIDGASRWKQTIHITIPGLLPIVILMSCLSLGRILNAGFEQVFNLYSPIVYRSGDIIDTLVYRLGLVDMRYSISTSVGLFKSVISFFLISISYKLAYKYAGYRIF
jgi:putative aldouronate transport system permease protein